MDRAREGVLLEIVYWTREPGSRFNLDDPMDEIAARDVLHLPRHRYDLDILFDAQLVPDRADGFPTFFLKEGFSRDDVNGSGDH